MIGNKIIFLVCLLGWVRLPDMPEPKGGFGCEVMDGNLYVVAGCTDGNVHVDTAYRYSIKDRTWMQLSSTGLPVQSPVLRAVHGKLYLIGGYNSKPHIHKKYDNVFEYDPNLNKWWSKSPMPTAREDMGSAILGDKIYVFGGIPNPSHKVLNVVEVYDTALDQWETIEPMSEKRCLGDFGAYWGNRIYIAGGTNTMAGYSAHLHPTKSVWCYDKSNGWISLADMPKPRCYAEAEVVNGLLFVAGGVVESVYNYTDSIVVYDIEKDKWSTGQKLPYIATNIGLASCDGTLYVCGGCNDNTRQKFISKFYSLKVPEHD